MKYYKVLRDGQACHGGTFDYRPYLPTTKRPGKWLPVIEDVSACRKGYHAATEEQLPNWLRDGNEIWEVEYKTEPLSPGDKVVGSCFRFVRKIGHAERVGVVGYCDGDLERIDEGLWLVVSGTIQSVYDGTIQSVYDGTIQYVYGGTIQYVRGGTIQSVYDGTIQYVRGGTIQSVNGGTIQSVNGGTIQSVYDGTIQYVYGGTIQYVYGGTIQSVDDGTLTIYGSNFALDLIAEGSWVVIDRTFGRPLGILTADSLEVGGR